uniref:Transposase IS200-like domain-containing protein n=1 Tax=Chlorobium chlorochromatii (strain CaD3) TaxID=340177 RepID=Q3AT47_CHLCH
MSIWMLHHKHHRHSIRLPEYDYSTCGAYFITICTQNRACWFGEIINGEMILNNVGKMVKDEWLKTEQLRTNVQCGAFVVMPNHLHGIIVINETVGAIHELPLQMSQKQRRNMILPKIIGRFKIQSSK